MKILNYEILLGIWQDFQTNGKAISFYIKQKQNNTPRPISVVLEPSTVREGNDSIIKNGPAKRKTLYWTWFGIVLRALSHLFQQLGMKRTHLEYVITKADDKAGILKTFESKDSLYLPIVLYSLCCILYSLYCIGYTV